MNREIRNKFIYQLQALQHKYTAQRSDIEKNLSDLHRDQTKVAIQLPFLIHEEHSKAMNRLEVIKKDIQNQKRELTKINDKITEANFELNELKKKENETKVIE